MNDPSFRGNVNVDENVDVNDWSRRNNADLNADERDEGFAVANRLSR